MYGNLGMERSRTMKNMEIWEWNGPEQWNVWKFRNGTVPHNEKNGIRECNKPEQWKKWDTGMKQA